jgi:hypothetical protein
VQCRDRAESSPSIDGVDRSVVDVGPHTTTDVDGAAGDASDAASGATNDV